MNGLVYVWAIADSKRQGYLGFKEFIIAMQACRPLLSLAQAGHELNSNLLKSSPSDVELLEPPEMEGLDSLLLFSLSSRQKHRGSRNNGVLETNGILAVQHVSPLSLFTTRLSKKTSCHTSLGKVTSIIDGLKRLYNEKLKPLEVAYRYNDFASPLLTTSDFDAKPMVMLLGQYSTGKTTFIKHLLKSNYPGAHIGPEPTTDRFIVVMGGPDERSVPGNTIAVQADMPFNALTTFGGAFLSKFECSQMPHPLLEHITFVDNSPGAPILIEATHRKKDMTSTCVIKWYAEKCDLILFSSFDPQKLDIMMKFKRVISSLHGQDDKIRVVLNKADQVDTQQFINDKPIKEDHLTRMGQGALEKDTRRPSCVDVSGDERGARRRKRACMMGGGVWTANNAGAILVLGRDLVVVPKLIHPLPLAISSPETSPERHIEYTWMQELNANRPPTPTRGRPQVSNEHGHACLVDLTTRLSKTSCHTSLGKVTSIIDGLKRLYNEKLKPLERNVDEAVKKLKQQGIEVLGVVCHVSNAQQRKNLLEQTVEVRMTLAHIGSYVHYLASMLTDGASTLDRYREERHIKELAPYDPDWYYIRAASMPRKIYLRGGLGVGAFQRIYGGSKRNGSSPPHFCKGSGGIARHISQQLQSMNIVDFDSKGEGIHDIFVKKVEGAVKVWATGDPFDLATRHGPQVERWMEKLEEAEVKRRVSIELVVIYFPFCFF
ncbi:EH domain-containing protein 1-like protein [Tanacetum coccineum]